MQAVYLALKMRKMTGASHPTMMSPIASHWVDIQRSVRRPVCMYRFPLNFCTVVATTYPGLFHCAALRLTSFALCNAHISILTNQLKK